MRVYLDTCCLSRLFNEQIQERIRNETGAVQRILDAIAEGQLKWIVSQALTTEVSKIRDWKHRNYLQVLINGASHHIKISLKENNRGKELEKLGFKHFDALHLACAESGNATVLLTTDDRLVRKANRLYAELRVKVQNPHIWLQEGGLNEHAKNDR